MFDLFKTKGLWLNWVGVETDLIFNKGVDLPNFASFPLLETEDGRGLLRAYYADLCEIGRSHGCGVVLESCTWMASSERGGPLGYDTDALERVNQSAIQLMEPFRAEGVLVSGNIGPCGDGYVAGSATQAQYAAYHGPQIASFAQTSADLITGMTIPTVAEAAGLIEAAQAVEKPIAISFVVETDGCLPDGTPLMEAIASCDDQTEGQAAFFMVNCAHPDHMAPAFAGKVSPRLQGAIANASRCTHAELDEAEVLDDGDPHELGGQMAALRRTYPQLAVLGGCCGTDLRHISEIVAAA